MKTKTKVVITKNGPYLVSGDLPLAKEIAVVGKEDEPEKWVKGEKYPQKIIIYYASADSLRISLTVTKLM